MLPIEPSPERPLDLATEADFQLDGWLVQPSRLELRRHGDERRLEPRVMALLVVLKRRPDQVLSRAELLANAWPEVVVGDEALTMAISKLRRILGQRQDGGPFVETVPRVGYRLTCLPRSVSEPPTLTVLAPSGPADPQPALRSSRSKRVVVLLGALGLMAALCCLAFWWASAARPSTVDGPPRSSGLTARPGLETQSSLDPDGRRVVFVGKRVAPQTYRASVSLGQNSFTPGFMDLPLDQETLEILDLATGEVDQILTGDLLAPSWSPRDQRIAFLQADLRAALSLAVIRSTGGVPEVLRRVRPSYLVGIDWSPEATHIAWPEYNVGRRVHEILEIEVASRRETVLTRPPADNLGDSRPVYSPDGRWLAFLRGDDPYAMDLWLLERASGTERQITHDQKRIWGQTWLPGSQSLVFASNRSGRYQLWKVDLDGSTPTWLPLPDEQVRFPVVRGNTMVYETFHLPSEMVRLQAVGGSVERMDDITSLARESAPAWSPDGKTLAFGSDRTGSSEVWLRSPDGGSRVVSDFGASLVHFISWAPDGRRLAVTGVADGEPMVRVIDLRSDEVLSVPYRPGWTRDKPIFTADGGSLLLQGFSLEGQSDIWRWPLESGTGPEPVTDFGMWAVRVSNDGTMYGLAAQGPNLLRRRRDGGWETVIADGFSPLAQYSWDIVGSFVHALELKGGEMQWRRWPLAGGEPELLGRVQPGLENGGFAVHPSGNSAVVARRLAAESDLRQVDLESLGEIP